MKKLLAVLVAFAFVAPAFAAEEAKKEAAPAAKVEKKEKKAKKAKKAAAEKKVEEKKQ